MQNIKIFTKWAKLLKMLTTIYWSFVSNKGKGQTQYHYINDKYEKFIKMISYKSPKSDTRVIRITGS